MIILRGRDLTLIFLVSEKPRAVFVLPVIVHVLRMIRTKSVMNTDLSFGLRMTIKNSIISFIRLKTAVAIPVMV